MRNEHLTGNGSGPEVGAQPTPRRAGVFQKTLSVLLSALLIVTMSPLANDASAIARAAEGTGAEPAATADGEEQVAGQNAPENGNPGGGRLQLS